MMLVKHTAALACASLVLLLGACSNNDDSSEPPAGETARLVVAVTGNGTVQSSPAGISCPATCSADFTRGSSLTLTATPGAGQQFVGWSGPNAGGCTTNPVCTGTLTGNSSITATFAPSVDPAGVVALTSTNKLISFNRASPDSPPVTSQTVKGLQSGETLVGIDFRPSDGVLFGLSDQSRIYRLDGRTGNATSGVALNVSGAPFALNGTEFGVDFNPTNNLLRIVSNAGQNLAVDPATGATAQQPALNGAATKATAVAYNSNVAGATGTVLFAIDTSGASDTLYIQNPATSGTLSAVGPLTVDASDVNGFEIVGSQDALAALTVAGSPRLYSINLATGATTTIATINTGEPVGTAVRGLAIRPTGTATQPGDAFVLFRGNQLASFNRATPQTLLNPVPVVGLKQGESLVGMDFQPETGTLYAVSGPGFNNLYTINPNSGLATLAFPLTAATGSTFAGLSGGAFGVGFDSVSDTLRIVSNGRQNLRVNVSDGTVVSDAALNRRAQPSPGPDVAATATGIATTNEFAGALSRTIYLIDSQTDVLATLTTRTVAPGVSIPGYVSDVDPLGINIDDVNGFDIDGVNGIAWAVFRKPEDGLNGLYQVGLASGAADFRGLVGNGTQDVIGLALRRPTPPVVYAVTTDNKLLSFSPEAPGVPLSGPTTITGIGAAEQVVGIDFRPSDGALVALTSNGRVYQLNPQTAAATAGQSLIRGTPDDPFTALSGPEVGIDFNPLGGVGSASLRVLSEASENFAVNPANGQVFSDPELSVAGPSSPPTPCDMAMAGPQVVGAAYSSNFAGGVSTTLYAIEASSSCLFTVDPPSGEMTPAGVLFSDPSASISTLAGFDIVGGHDGLRLAALQTDGGQSRLYTVDLGGGLTGIGDGVEEVDPDGNPDTVPNGEIGPAGTAPVRGIAIRLPATTN